jgi:hypothetical protein
VTRQTLGRALISAAIVLSAMVSTGIDLSRGDTAHVHNPAWHPHAIFHDVVMFLLLDFMGLVCLWLLWRKSSEPEVGVRVAALLMLGFWSHFYYVTTLFPAASLAATPENVGNGAILVSWAPFPLYINVLVGTFLLATTAVGYFLYSSGARKSPQLSGST